MSGSHCSQNRSVGDGFVKSLTSHFKHGLVSLSELKDCRRT